MLGKYAWLGLAVGATYWAYRRSRLRWWASKDVLKANSAESVLSPDDTGAAVTILTNQSEIELYVRCWGEEGPETRGAIVLVHGGMWHSKYFTEFAEALVKKHFLVYSFDHQGHGLSGCSLRGLRGNVEKYDDYVVDTDLVVDTVRSNHPELPLFVYGESFGGAIALSWSLEPTSTQKVNGLVVSGSMVKMQEQYLPPKCAMAVLAGLVQLFPNMRAPGNQLEATFDDAFGDDKVPEAARNDPLVIFESPTVRYALELIRGMGKLSKSLESVSVPFLALHGKDDVRVSPDNSQRLMDTAGSSDKTLKLYDGMKHQLLQETEENKERVFNDIVDWLESHAPQPAEFRKSLKKVQFEAPVQKTEIEDEAMSPGPSELTDSGVDHEKVLKMLDMNGF